MPFVTGYCANVISVQSGNAILSTSFTNENNAVTGKQNCDWSVSATGSLLKAQKQFEMLSAQSPVSSDYELTINPEIYTTVSGWILVSFVSGHVLGRILKTLGKG